MARNVSALFGAQLVTWVMSTSVAVVVPRLVGPEAIGHYQLSQSIWAVGLATVSLGTNTLVTLEVARRREGQEIDLGPALVARLAAYTLAWIPLGGFVVLAGYGDQVRTLFLIGGAATLMATIAELARSALTGLENLGAVAAVDIVSKTVMTGVMVGAAVATKDVRVVAVAALVPVALSAVLLFRRLRASTTTVFTRSPLAAWSATRQSAPYLADRGGVRPLHAARRGADVVLRVRRRDRLVRPGRHVVRVGAVHSHHHHGGVVPRQARTHAEDPEAALVILEQGFRTLTLLAIPIGLGIVLVADCVVGCCTARTSRAPARCSPSSVS